ncbi:2-dehydropantoate 2-reductase N-terminal domain-containing protein [Streptomyces sp. M19]
MARIFIVGSGVVGTATGKGFLRAGHEVTFVDILPQRLQYLRSQGLDARSALDLRSEPDGFVFLTLPTPNVGHRYDLTAFEDGTASVGEALAAATGTHVVVVRSTVPRAPPRAPCARCWRSTREGPRRGLHPGQQPGVPARRLRDRGLPPPLDDRDRLPQHADRGAAQRPPLALRRELRTFANPAEAELIKCAHNIYNATKISFWNEMWLVSQTLGLDLDPIAQTVARSAEGSYNPLYGIRGGARTAGVPAKDTQGFLGLAETMRLEMPLLKAVVRVNDTLAEKADREADALTAQLA